MAKEKAEARPMTLKEKLHAIYHDIDYIEKTGENTHQHYKYIQSADVTREIRDQLFKQRVYAEINFDFAGAPYTIAREKSPDAPFSVVNVKCSVLFRDLDSDETATGSALGSGADMGDKAVYKAQTGALKYALKNSFLVPDAPGASMDPEADGSTDEATDGIDLRDNRRGAPAPRTAATPKAEPTPEALARAFGTPIAEVSGLTPPQLFGATPAGISTPSTESTSTVPAREPGDESENEPPTLANNLPTEEQMTGFRMRFTKLADDLSSKGKLTASAGIKLNRKLLVFLMSVEKVDDAKNLTVEQWEDFFKRADTLANAENGLVNLTKLVNKANGIEDTKKGKK